MEGRGSKWEGRGGEEKAFHLLTLSTLSTAHTRKQSSFQSIHELQY